MKKMDNKGFSLVELIIVIAIMAILVGVLAPTFMKYVEQSRRSADISTAEEIRQAVLADISDDLNGVMYTETKNEDGVDFEGGSCTSEDELNGSKATSISASPVCSGTCSEGNVEKGNKFVVIYDTETGTCEVHLGDYNLSDGTQAANYKQGLAASAGE